MTKRVLITGGAGFIGSHLVEAYCAEGWSVSVLDNLTKGRRDNVPVDVTFHELDVRSAEARALVAGGQFDLVSHQAAQADVRVSVSDPDLDADINVAGLINLLEGARQGGVARFVFASSGGVVYGEKEAPPYAETSAKLPASPYGASKLASEYYLAVYHQLYGVEVVSLRYANVYGPRQDPHGEAGVVAIFGRRLKDGERLTVFGDGEQTRDYVYAGDVARANLAATAATLPALTTLDSRAFNVGTGVETTVNGLAAQMAAAAERPLEIDRVPARPGELARNALRVGKAERELGWRPQTSLEEGVRMTYRWIAET